MEIQSVRITTKAENDLKKIEDFLNIHSKSTVEGTFERIFDKIELLWNFPNLGSIEPLLSDKPLIYRYLVERPYKIIYSIIDNDIFINRIFDTRQNPRKLKP